MSLIRTDAYEKLRRDGWLRKPDSVNPGQWEKVTFDGNGGYTTESSGGVRRKHKFSVAPKLCHQMILGEDWLRGGRPN